MSFTSIEKRDRVAVIWLDQPNEKMNKLSLDLLDEFRQLMDRLEEDTSIDAAVMISRKPDNFIAGADIEQFLGMTEPGQAETLSRDGNALLKRMAEAPKPIVAAINGAALGGGLEVALACHYRIATDAPKTILGLPEVQLGLLPGGGGTQRLPRLIGLQRALDLLLTGKNVFPHPARKMGLVDLVTHPAGLLDTACQVARDLAPEPYRRPDHRGLVEKLLEGNVLGRKLVFKKAREMVLRRTRGNYPAPLKILECVETGLAKGMEAGLEAEARNFGILMRTAECRELIQLFFSMTAAKKNALAEKARSVQRVGIVGGGLMGSGIADVSINKGLHVFLKDMNLEAISKAQRNLWEGLSRKVRKRAISEFRRDEILARFHGITDDSGFRNCQIVIEAVFEDLELKRQILRDIESVSGEETIFASNTSSLPIGKIAEASQRPEQVIGMHYFSPVQKMPLLEIIITDQTAEWVRGTAYDIGVRQGKTVIVVKDGPGFYTTRILAPMMNEALLLLQEGASIEALDKAMKDFGFPVGPITLMDEVGLDVGAHVTDVLSEMFSERGVTPVNLARQLVDAGYKGRKNKKGFYTYPTRGKKRVNSEIYRFFGGQRREIDAEKMQQRLTLVMVNEAMLCLQEGILEAPQDGDLGAILGLGFPPFLGGPFRYADSLGASTLLSRLEDLQQEHGVRFKPAPIVAQKAASSTTFYPSSGRY